MRNAAWLKHRIDYVLPSSEHEARLVREQDIDAFAEECDGKRTASIVARISSATPIPHLGTTTGGRRDAWRAGRPVDPAMREA